MDAATLKKRLDAAIEKIHGLDDNETINAIVEEIVTDLTGAEYSSVWVNDFPKLYRFRKTGLKKLSMEEKHGLLYRCYLTQQPAIYNYITSEKGYVPAIDNPDDIRIKSKITIPLLYEDQLVGIVTCYSSVRRVKNFTPADLEKFRTVTPFVIDAICHMLTNMGKPPIKSCGRGGCSCRIDDGTQIVEKLETIEQSHKKSGDLAELMTMTSQFVHDIRTPANNLYGFLEILEEQIADKRLKEYVGYAKSSAALINSLTTSILDNFARRQAGLSADTVEKVNTKLFFSETAHIFSANMWEKRIVYNIYLDPLLPQEITVDTMRLKRVLINLIGNALKFTPEKGTIELSVSYDRDKGRMLVSIQDSGVGIPKERQAEIFKPYTQADETTKEKYGGTGLGLAICAEYVEALGGKLQLESEVDRGSRFYFDFPVEEGAIDIDVQTEGTFVTLLLAKEDVAVARNIGHYLLRYGIPSERIKAVQHIDAVPEETTHLIVFQKCLTADVLRTAKKHRWKRAVMEQEFLSLDPADYDDVVLMSQYEYYGGDRLKAFITRRRPVRVLIVEDDKISVSLLTTILKEEYCEIDVAHDGLDGFFLLKEALASGKPYDIVYTDKQMPGMTGPEMMQDYRELEKEVDAASIRAVSISGDPEDVKYRGLFDHFAGKPFKKEEIKAIFDLTQQGGDHAAA